MKITSIEPQKKNKKIYSIYIDGKYTFSLEDIELAKLSLKEGQEITNENIESYIQAYEFSKAFDRALRFASFKRRTQAQLEKKMLELDYGDDIIRKVIKKMKELKYLDDEQYAEDYIEERTNMKPSGKRLIAMELKNKGINEQTIIKKLESSEIDEYNLAYGLAEKKISRIQNLDRKELQRIYAFLMRRGFSSNLVLKVLKDLQKGDYFET